ncbi:DUF1684 domain-containing protein [Zunongwangia endophytica]|uniref:DUF1684 domain-containing protein n=1 Tax=Zunongwangia endophytica TaxID=1808945 RepID=A0ABV8HGQ4_9FLAO|nr:DUF1684 domain-containing protein [Zunongwangia endophytica]MDN3593340.1 DUF1684 domain-containing protein [Zunongwangia endophytica]
MKKLPLILILFGTIFSSFCQEKTKDPIDQIKTFQEHLNEEYRSPEESPLSEEERLAFKGHDFYEIDTSFIVEATFVRTALESPFRMQTSSDRQPIYVKYADLYFTLKGKELKLAVYQSQTLKDDPKYFDYLFLPFTDDTNGKGSYAGGRYIDLKIPKEGTKEIILDFNKAYNPYCAYSGGYSCPVPPTENNLDLKISAGVKAY